jgi:hypothetical protein
MMKPKGNDNKIRTSIFVTREHFEYINRYAADLNVSIAWVVRHAIDYWIRNRRKT